MLEGDITRLVPGARALGYFMGFDRTKAQAETRFIDQQSGRVVLVTADRREVQAADTAESPEGRLRGAFDEMARGLSSFLVRLSRGEVPTKE